MITGETINQRDIIERPKVNYRALDALNCSMIKLFDSDPVKFYEQFKLGKKRKDNKTTSLAIGDLVDFYLLDCKGDEVVFNTRFDEKFALFEGTKGSGQVFILADTLFEITVESLDENDEPKTDFATRFSETFKRVQADGKYKKKDEDFALRDFDTNGSTYFQTLIDNIGKLVIDESLLTKSVKVAEMLRTHEFTKEVFADSDPEIEYFPKHVIEWTCVTPSKAIPCKSELDMIKVDHHNKIIYPRDLKTTYDNESFEYGYLKHGYYLQAAFYAMAVQYWAQLNNMSDYFIEPMEFIVGDTSANNRIPARYKLTEKDMMKAMYGFKVRGVYYNGLTSIIEEILWAEENDIWNASRKLVENKGHLKLNLEYE